MAHRCRERAPSTTSKPVRLRTSKCFPIWPQKRTSRPRLNEYTRSALLREHVGESRPRWRRWQTARQRDRTIPAAENAARAGCPLMFHLRMSCGLHARSGPQVRIPLPVCRSPRAKGAKPSARRLSSPRCGLDPLALGKRGIRGSGEDFLEGLRDRELRMRGAQFLRFDHQLVVGRSVI
jgi:hypothetical protein